MKLDVRPHRRYKQYKYYKGAWLLACQAGAWLLACQAALESLSPPWAAQTPLVEESTA